MNSQEMFEYCEAAAKATIERKLKDWSNVDPENVLDLFRGDLKRGLRKLQMNRISSAQFFTENFVCPQRNRQEHADFWEALLDKEKGKEAVNCLIFAAQAYQVEEVVQA